ncbi:MAG TPA: cupredoxin domain-containing protein [Candidatus Limnocylindrales bacterium]|jgi:plastocyanin|nr:cupredoxin domain-containing protein [Candidatus Limnocylindrales bacterium]
MRFARSLPVALLSIVVVAGCATASAGWTYAPAPSVTPPPAPSGSATASGPAPSGSGLASAPVPSASSPGASAPSGSGNLVVVDISALNIKYEQTALTAPANTPFQISFENKDAGVPHNVTLHLGDTNGAELFKGEIFNGVATRVYDVPALDAGSYAFVCSVHPTMIGTLTVQ